MALTPDGSEAISASSDKTLKVWDLKSGKELRTLQGHSHWFRAAAVTPDRYAVISASEDRTLKIWDLTSGNFVASFTANGAIQACAVAGDGTIVGDMLQAVCTS